MTCILRYQTRIECNITVHLGLKKDVYNFLEGKGTTVKGQEGGGDMVIPARRSYEPVTAEKPLVHRPCVVEKKAKGKVLRTYGTLLDPRTNPRYLLKYGYTDVE